MSRSVGRVPSEPRGLLPALEGVAIPHHSQKETRPRPTCAKFHPVGFRDYAYGQLVLRPHQPANSNPYHAYKLLDSRCSRLFCSSRHTSKQISQRRRTGVAMASRPTRVGGRNTEHAGNAAWLATEKVVSQEFDVTPGICV